MGSKGLEINPRFSCFIRSGTRRYQADVNLIKPLVLANPSRVEPYVGLGLALERLSFTGAGATSQTNVGFNYIVGGTVKVSGRLQPFGQFQYSVLNDAGNNAVVSVGLHFVMGKATPAAKPATKPAAPARR